MRGWVCGGCRAQQLLRIGERHFSTSRAHLKRVNVSQLLRHNAEAKDVDVFGWVRSVRKQKKIGFAAVGDGSTVESVQAVLKPEDAAKLSTGAAVKLSGSWQASQGSKQSHELQVRQATPLGENDAERNPLQPKYQTPDYLRTIPHLRPRIPGNALLLRLRSEVIASLTNFFHREGYIECHTPIITSSDCEGAGEVFTVSSNESRELSQTQAAKDETPTGHFFRTPKYLTVSSQLHLEALSQAVDKVWTLSPTFRAEKSDTPRHLSEFYMLEAELCFTESLEDVMSLVERMLMAISQTLWESQVGTEILRARETSSTGQGDESGEDVASTVLRQRWDGMRTGDWPRISYADAIIHLQRASQESKATFVFPPTYSDGLQAEHERYLAATVGEGKRPVFVTDYPAEQKPFYMSPSTSGQGEKQGDTVSCFDLLVPDLCELVGGSLREHRSEALIQTMKEKGVAGSNLEWYQDLRRYGSVPHGGFGLGFDRLLCYLSGVSNGPNAAASVVLCLVLLSSGILACKAAITRFSSPPQPPTSHTHPGNENQHFLVQDAAQQVTSHAPSGYLDAAPNTVGLLLTSAASDGAEHLWLPLGRKIYTRDDPDLPLHPLTARITTMIRSTPEQASLEALELVVCEIYPTYNRTNQETGDLSEVLSVSKQDGMVGLAEVAGVRPWREVEAYKCS
ncbi:asparaginyl-tRNA synthetase [Hortaea werneckii]|nr:asparaginyl-tRNA synthetase [Hortaea werneckii]